MIEEPRFVVAPLVVGLVATFVLAHQLHRTPHFDIGERDVAWLADLGDFHPPQTLAGTRPRPGAADRAVAFQGRVTGLRPGFVFPWGVVGSDAIVRVRGHALGRRARAAVSANGTAVGTLEFEGEVLGPRELVVPRRALDAGPLRLVFAVEPTGPEPPDAPVAAGLALDWIELEPATAGGLVRPMWPPALAFVVLLGFAVVATRGMRTAGRVAVLSLAGGAPSAAVAWSPLPAGPAVIGIAALGIVLLGLARLFAWLSGRNREWALRFAALSVSSAVSVAALEVALRGHERRLADRPPATADRLPLLEPALGGGYRLRPRVQLDTEVPGYAVRISTNSHGMHWREVPVQPPAARERVAFLGDSFTFGCWVPRVEESFVGVFDRLVQADGLEALNFGVGGYGLADQRKLLEDRVLAFGPRYVVVVVFNGNDFRDTHLGLEKDRVVDGAAELDERVLRAKVPSRWREGTTVMEPSVEPWPARALRRFATFRLAAPWLRMENLAVEFEPSTSFTAYSFWSRVPPAPVALDARETTLVALQEIERLAAARGARLAVVALPTREQVHARRLAGPGFDLRFPQEWIRVFARDRGIPYLDAMPVLRGRFERTNERLFVPGDTHLNARGHRLVGEAVAEWFRCCVRRRER